MPSTAIWVGRLLILLGVVGYGYGLTSGSASLTALIPAAFGLILMVLGHVAAARENLRKHVMHAAVLIAVIGFIMTAGRLALKFSELSLTAGVVSQALMAVICLAFVVLAVRSFAAARSGDQP